MCSASLWPSDLTRQIKIDDHGFAVGAGTLLASLEKDTSLLNPDTNRVLVLLSVACRKPLSRNTLVPIKEAAAHWRNGDKALANFRLIFSDLPRLNDPADAYRMRVAEYLLDEGMTPHELMKELGLDASHLGVAKYDENEPRVPTGNGRQSGRWGSVTGTFVLEDASPTTATPVGPATAATAIALSATAIDLAIATEVAGTLASGLFAAAGTATEFLAGLATFAVGIGTGVTLGAIIVPSPNDIRMDGDLPGDPDLNYSLLRDEGVLRLTHETVAGTELVATAHRNRDGIFFESETGIPIARQVGDSVVFDAASLANVAPEVQTQARADAQAKAKADTDEPQLCPAPSKDVPHWASDRAIAYQTLVSALNNPERGPLQIGMAVSLINPATGRRVVYDDCRESDGTMIEAKGPGYAKLLRYEYFSTRIMPARWTNQATRQILARGGRNIDWFVAEDTAAAYAKKLFMSIPGLNRINVLHVPAVVK